MSCNYLLPRSGHHQPLGTVLEEHAFYHSFRCTALIATPLHCVSSHCDFKNASPNSTGEWKSRVNSVRPHSDRILAKYKSNMHRNLNIVTQNSITVQIRQTVVRNEFHSLFLLGSFRMIAALTCRVIVNVVLRILTGIFGNARKKVTENRRTKAKKMEIRESRRKNSSHQVRHIHDIAQVFSGFGKFLPFLLRLFFVLLICGRWSSVRYMTQKLKRKGKSNLNKCNFRVF